MLQPLQIGSLKLANNLILAPMAGITNLPFRLLARRQGAALAFTEMVSGNGLIRDGQKSFALVASTPEDRPLGIQLFGDDPAVLAEAARLVAPFGELLDLNLGCPVRKVVGSGAGSALLREPTHAATVIRAVRRACSLPLTVKIRSGWAAKEPVYREIGRIAEEEGCDAIAFHPRSRCQMFAGKADWQQLADLKSRLRIPVLGSGDLFSAADVLRMLHSTGCDGVLLARGVLGNPWLFREVAELATSGSVTPPTPAERQAVAREHLQLFSALSGEAVAVREMRKHLAWYVHGLPGAAQFRRAVNNIATREAMEQLLTDYFAGVPT